MFRRYYSLGLLAVWLAVAFCLLAPESMVPTELRRHLGGPFRLPCGVMAIVFAMYNLARWWSYQSLDRDRFARAGNPLAVRRRDPIPEPLVPNPDLDFLKRPDPAPPSQDGDQRSAP